MRQTLLKKQGWPVNKKTKVNKQLITLKNMIKRSPNHIANYKKSNDNTDKDSITKKLELF